MTQLFQQPISEEIWRMKYRFGDEQTVEDTWMRVARALAEAESESTRDHWTGKFYEAMRDFKFLPAGRIIAGAGTGRNVTLFNCFVMGTIPDSMEGIFEMLKEAALTMQQGGGIGYDFSTIRPNGAPVAGVGADASGPLTFMDVWDAMCRTVMSAGSRRGAMMATMRCDHPDILDFIEAKRDAARLRMFNVSVLVTDAFMQCVEHDTDWPLWFNGTVYGEIRARELWDRITRATYDVAEPGVIFIDRVNATNPLRTIETISSTNPCAEQPLPPYGACLLGSINLAAFVRRPFSDESHLALSDMEQTVKTAVRMMDNVVDVSRFPLEAQAVEARAKRRIGLGVTGLADALAMRGIRYGSKIAVSAVSEWMRIIEDAAMEASQELAEEKGAFPLWTEELGPKRRNSHLTSIAPTGTISLFANNVSSGIEPIFANSYERKVLQPDGSRTSQRVEDYAVRLYRKLDPDGPLPHYFVTAQDLLPIDHIRMQAAAQPFVDSAISKTINVPEDISFEQFQDVYQKAYEMGCKGCTTYRPNDVTGSVLSVDAPATEAAPEPDVPALGEPVPAEPLADRPEALMGVTYKVKWPGAAHAFYITINNVEDAGGVRPFEIFVATKNSQHMSWITALTRMISAVFRRGGNVDFVVEELRAVIDSHDTAYMNSKFVPSIQAMIGDVIARHIADTCEQGDWFPFDDRVGEDEPPASGPLVNVQEFRGATITTNGKPCKQCGSTMLVKSGGCDTCMSCGHSECG